MSPAVHFWGVSKHFRIGESHASLGEFASALFKRRRKRKTNRESTSTFWALRNLDFAVAQGEAIGIIGPNGAGKSTVLKLISRILRPDEGRVRVQGRLAALIEVGAGFHGDLTGRENVFLNGSILGMSRREITRKLDAIVAFAGIERFLDMPVKRYSSGMYARLGFSIAAHVDPQVLLVDEVLSVGDAVFRQRCLDRMHDMVKGGTTLVFVTHNLDQLQSICRRAIVLESGRCSFDGPARDGVSFYLRAVASSLADRPTDFSGEQGPSRFVNSVSLRFKRGQKETSWLRFDEPLHAELTIDLHQSVQRLVVELNMHSPSGDHLISINSARDQVFFDAQQGVNDVTMEAPRVNVCGGHYFWNVRLWDADSGLALTDTPFQFPLLVDDGGRATGKLCLEHSWNMEKVRDPAAQVNAGVHRVHEKAGLVE